MSVAPNSRMISIFRDHPALLISAFYVAASVVGMFYAWAYLGHFGVNVFNYAQVSDFLVASLKEPFTWVLVAIAVILVLLDNASSRRVQSKKPGRWLRWYASPRYRFANNFVAVLIVLAFLNVFAGVEAREVRAGHGKHVDVAFSNGGHTRTLTLLGTTGQFVILYDAALGQVHIHPLESIDSISFRTD